jgi:phosphatidate cytidylyltransferase
MSQPTELSAAAARPEDSAASAAARGTSLLVRIATGLGAGAFVIVLIFLPQEHGLPFVLAVSGVGITAMSELFRAVRRQGGEPSEFLGYLACILIELSAWRMAGNNLDDYLPALLTLLVLVAMLAELIKPKQKPILNVGATLLGAIYCGWLLSFLVLIHGWHRIAHPPIGGTTAGEWLCVFTIAVTSFNDVGGLFVGNAYGRHKLAPSISPKKTWEGMIGGIALSMIVAFLLALWTHMPLWPSVVLGALLAVAGLTGDLCESALKRELGVKDFGILLPGHGGILDRIDSVLFAAPVAFYGLLLIGHLTR